MPRNIALAGLSFLLVLPIAFPFRGGGNRFAPDLNACRGLPDGLYPNPRNSATFFQCSNGNTHIQPCPARLVYDDTCKCCNRPNGPTDPNASFCTGRPNGLYPNPSNSANFFQCSNGNTYIQPCQQGLVYDDTCKCCNWP